MIDERLFKTGAVVLGFMSHLVLDELYSIEWTGWRFRFKKSFGTAIKMWSGNTWGNVSTYGKLILIAALAFGDPIFMRGFEHTDDNLGHHNDDEENVPHTTKDWLRDILRNGERLIR